MKTIFYRYILCFVLLLGLSGDSKPAGMESKVQQSDHVGYIEIASKLLKFSKGVSEVRVLHKDNSFFVVDGDNTYKVNQGLVSKDLRGLTSDEIERVLGVSIRITLNGNDYVFVKSQSNKELDLSGQDCIHLDEETSKEIISQIPSSGCLVISKVSDREYSVELQHQLIGGGGGGAVAGAWFGRWIVYVVAHADMAIVAAAASIVITPAGGAVLYTSMVAASAPAVEGAAMVGALIGGVSAGVATGPV